LNEEAAEEMEEDDVEDSSDGDGTSPPNGSKQRSYSVSVDDVASESVSPSWNKSAQIRCRCCWLIWLCSPKRVDSLVGRGKGGSCSKFSGRNSLSNESSEERGEDAED
jgi:hypothetical protein